MADITDIYTTDIYNRDSIKKVVAIIQADNCNAFTCMDCPLSDMYKWSETYTCTANQNKNMSYLRIYLAACPSDIVMEYML